MKSLERFVQAQQQSGLYERVLHELRQGNKQSHWMWFIFPQIDGLGMSQIAVMYAIADSAEAAAYLQHPLLGPRLLECSNILLELSDENLTAEQILGPVDSMKLRSSMTLFAAVCGDYQPVFQQVLDRYFHGEPDPMTLRLLAT